MNPHTSDIALKPRTRTNVRQSKYGCYTCKARRVKCDETKPSCRRCVKACRKCEGYPLGAPSVPRASTGRSAIAINFDKVESARQVNRPICVQRDFEEQRLQCLGCSVFVKGSMDWKPASEMTFWACLVPKLVCSVDTIKLAAAAFGASYEHQILKDRSNDSWLTVLRQTSAAVNKLQQDVVSLPDGPIPVVVACILLACAETLRHNNTTALKHVRGAFAAIGLCRPHVTHSHPDTDTQTHEMYRICQRLDIQVAGYSPGTVPELSVSLGSNYLRMESLGFSMNTADRTLIQALHCCYRFTSQAHKYRYQLGFSRRHLLLVEQGRQIANLTSWLSWFKRGCDGQALLTHNPRSLVLQAQCLSALILASSILDPYESSYDRFATQFQVITQSAEQALNTFGRGEGLPRFNLENSLIQPLFFTATKYRDPVSRSKAISLLRACGREGPWCGYVHAASAEVLIRAEEEAALADVRDGGRTFITRHDLVPGDVKEEHRIVSNVIHDIVEDDNGSEKVIIQLSKCRDMQLLLSCSAGLGPEEEEHWLVWNETYDLSGQ